MLFALYNTLVPWTCILQLPVYAEHSNIVYFENSTKNSCNILFKLMTHWKITAVKVVRDKKKKTENKRKALNLSVNVFSTKVIIGDTIFTSTTAILRGHFSRSDQLEFWLNGSRPSGFIHYCAFHKHANSEVQKPTDDCVFCCRQSS